VLEISQVPLFFPPINDYSTVNEGYHIFATSRKKLPLYCNGEYACKSGDDNLGIPVFSGSLIEKNPILEMERR